MSNRLKALSVHLLTATGAVLALFAMHAAVTEQWSVMFSWLVVALIVDGVDGPLARKFDTARNWPTYDGVLMDLIVDYLTYVFIPAYALLQSGLVEGWSGWVALIAMVYGSVIYFADTRMKTKDKSFAGFPACWNMVVLVLFAVHPSPAITCFVIILLTVAMFTNLKFIHPTRTKRWRNLSLPMSLAWTVFATWAAWEGFTDAGIAYWGLLLTSLYLTFVGILQQIIPEQKA